MIEPFPWVPQSAILTTLRPPFKTSPTRRKKTKTQRRSKTENEASTLGKTFKIATLNVQGLNEITKRQTMEKWAAENKIDLVMVQETRINDSSKEEKPKHIWFFSTSTKYKDKEQVEKKRAGGGRATRAEWKQALEYRGVGALTAKKTG